MNPTPLQSQTRLSTALVIVLTLAALALGWLVRLRVERAARVVTQGGVSIEVPADWVITAGESEQLFVCWNVLAPEHRCSASLTPLADETELPTLASQRQFQRGATLTSFRVLDQTPVVVNGRDGYKVTYAYVDPRTVGQLPVVIEGAEYYFKLDGQAVVVSFEDDAAAFQTSAADFQRMLGSLTVREAGRGEGG